MEYQYGALLPVAEVKAAGDVWEVSGYVSTFGNTDRGGDVVMPGAFDRTLAGIKSLPLFLGHNPNVIIGASRELRTDDYGLFARFELSKGPDGLNAHENLRVGALKTFSIGYQARDADFTDDGIRKLLDIDLFEGSLLPETLPMNTAAVVTGFKSFQINDDVPFGVLLKQLVDGIDRGATEAEALWARRLSDGREPSDAHIEAVKQLLSAAEAVGMRLSDLLSPRSEAEADDTGTPDGSAAEADAESKSAPSADTSLRLALARQRIRLRDLGLLEKAS